MQPKERISCIRHEEEFNKDNVTGRILNYVFQSNSYYSGAVQHLQYGYAELTYYFVSFLFNCRDIEIKIAWYWQNTWYQWNKVENTSINSRNYSHKMSDKHAKIHCRKGSVFNKWCSENWMHTSRKME